MSDPAKTISFQGAHGANSEIACLDAYPDMTTLPCRTFEGAFDAVHSGKAALAMIPIDNTVAGRVADIHHLLPDSGLHIIGEFYLKIKHHLLAVEGAKIEDITHIHSHVHALSQCRNLIAELGVEAVVNIDTAAAAIEVAQSKDKTQAAIASFLAAKLDGLVSLRTNIEDAEHNTTRFVVLAPAPLQISPDLPNLMTSFVFEIRNIPAALYKALGGFATNGINITKLESYVGGDFVAAQFYADVEGHPEQVGLKMALEELDFFTHEIRLLGTYPAHEFRYS